MLEQLFEYYHERKLNEKGSESKKKMNAYAKVFDEIIISSDDSDGLEGVMEAVSSYGIEAEKEGFINGFRVA